MIVCTVCTAESPVQKHPEVVEAFQCEMLRAAGWDFVDPDEV